MTDRETKFASLGLEYAEGIEFFKKINLPSGREIHKVPSGWECQPWNDNYWRTFEDLLDAVKFATKPENGGAKIPSQFADDNAI